MKYVEKTLISLGILSRDTIELLMVQRLLFLILFQQYWHPDQEIDATYLLMSRQNNIRCSTHSSGGIKINTHHLYSTVSLVN